MSVLSPRHAHQRAVYCPAQLATKFRGCPKLGLKAVSHSVLCCALFLGSLAVIQAPPASRVGAGNMIMEASVEMEKIEPGVVVAQQPVVARDPGEALRRGDIGGYLGDGVVLRQQTSQCCRVLCCQPNIDWVCTPWTPEID